MSRLYYAVTLSGDFGEEKLLPLLSTFENPAFIDIFFIHEKNQTVVVLVANGQLGEFPDSETKDFETFDELKYYFIDKSKIERPEDFQPLEADYKEEILKPTSENRHRVSSSVHISVPPNYSDELDSIMSSRRLNDGTFYSVKKISNTSWKLYYNKDEIGYDDAFAHITGALQNSNLKDIFTLF